MRTQSAISPLAVGLLLCLFAQSTNGAIVTYSDRSAWTTGAGGGTGTLVDNLDSGGFTRTGYTISGTGLGAHPNFNAQTSINGSGYLRAFLEDSGTPTTVIFTFSSPITAMGYDLNPQGFNLGATVNFAIDGTPAGTYNLPGTDVNGFQGFVSTTPFTSLTLSTTGGSAWHGIDNLEAFVSVPEPAGMALAVSLGIGAFVLARRRNSQCRDQAYR